MIVMILSSTTSSPDESLVSNLHREMALLSSDRAAVRESASGPMRPQTKKLCRDVRAVEVMGPVDNGERMMAQKGESTVGRGRLVTAVRQLFSTYALTCQDTADLLRP